MANVTILKNTFTVSIPPDGTHFFNLGPMDVFRTGGAINVTAIPRSGAPLTTLFMEVVQMAVRQEVVTFGAPNFSLDIVVRNNSHQNDPEATTITAFDVFTSVVTE
jgi:hypothetical protein